MRTTIEIDDDKLVKLRKLAAERGKKGYSGIIDEALEKYFAAGGEESELARRERQAHAIRALAGSIDEATAERMRESVRESRKHWRLP